MGGGFRRKIFANYLLFVMACQIPQVCSTKRPKVLVTHRDVPEPAIKMLQESCDVIINEECPTPNKNQIKAKIGGIDGLFYASHIKLDAELLDAAGPQLKMVSTMSVGYDHIDTQELKKRNILFSNTPGVLVDAVADLAVMLAIAAGRRIHEGRQHIEKGTWIWGTQWMLGRDLTNSTVGIVGFGAIGSAIANRLVGFKVDRILYSGHKEKESAKAIGAKLVSLDTLLAESDFIIVAAPLTNETQGMFNDTAFSKMKKTAVFVNVARGGLVDQPSLYRALKEGKIFAAGLDVMTPEPLPTDDPLLSLPNCVLIPHLGSATHKTRTNMATLAADNLLRGLKGEKLVTPVNI